MLTVAGIAEAHAPQADARDFDIRRAQLGVLHVASHFSDSSGIMRDEVTERSRDADPMSP